MTKRSPVTTRQWLLRYGVDFDCLKKPGTLTFLGNCQPLPSPARMALEISMLPNHPPIIDDDEYH